MARIIIRHLSGSRAHQIDEFPAESLSGITAGREATSNIRFDPQRDDMVSREHLRITPEFPGSQTFLLADLNSRNGTFLNRQRVTQPMVLRHNDVVQLGLEGPELRFELDPPPASAARPTRLMSGIGTSSQQGLATREVSLSEPVQPRPIGRATVERMLGDTFGKVKHESNKTFWIGIAAIVLIGVVGLTTFLMLHRSSSELDAQSAAQQKLLRELTQVSRQPAAADPAERQQIAQMSAELKRLMAQTSPSSAAAKAQGELGTPVQSSASPPADTSGNYNALFQRASQEYRSGDSYSAYKDCASLITMDQNNWTGYYLAGLSLVQLQQPGQAAAYYQYALQYAPDSARSDISQKLAEAQAASQQTSAQNAEAAQTVSQ